MVQRPRAERPQARVAPQAVERALQPPWAQPPLPTLAQRIHSCCPRWCRHRGRCWRAPRDDLGMVLERAGSAWWETRQSTPERQQRPQGRHHQPRPSHTQLLSSPQPQLLTPLFLLLPLQPPLPMNSSVQGRFRGRVPPPCCRHIHRGRRPPHSLQPRRRKTQRGRTRSCGPRPPPCSSLAASVHGGRRRRAAETPCRRRREGWWGRCVGGCHPAATPARGGQSLGLGPPHLSLAAPEAGTHQLALCRHRVVPGRQRLLSRLRVRLGLRGSSRSLLSAAGAAAPC